ncbi:unnamed protein product, partial [Rotaria sordida]
MGVKGVLIEYGDILPLEEIFVDVGHQAGYTKSDRKLTEKAAKENEIEIIPLIQTFVISPCLNATYVLLQDLLQQTLDMHPNSNKIHIGCDEVMLNNVHDECYIKQMKKSERYIDHIQCIVNIVHQIRPGIRVLIWDDILRHDEFTKNDKLLSQLKGLVEPVSWNYVPTFHDYYKTLSAWKIYPKFFNNIWAASAFKAYPSLLYSLHILNTDEFLADNPFYDCETLMKSIGKYSQLYKLLPGISIYSSISSLFTVVSKIQNLLKLLYDTSPEYNRKYSFVRRYELDSQLTELKGFQNDLLSSKERLNHDLSNLYSKDIIDEWFDLYVIPIENQMYKAYIDFSPVFNITSWVRRPLI